ncbi:MAG TPA: carboxypeptidase M32 [Phycisphaerales bacterium]|nr:carboxypeptidase M32 [Phycisphaerales bacterium]
MPTVAKSKSGASKARKTSSKGTPPPPDPFDLLCAELRAIAVLESVQRTLSWDQETLMPAGGSALRADQLQALSGMLHERRTSRKFGDLLRASEEAHASSDDELVRADLRELRRDYDKARTLPKALVQEITRTQSLGIEAWKHARQGSNFKAFLPWLQKTVDLSLEKARCYGVPKGGEPYDPLLDDFEPGMTAAQTREVFTPLRARLVPLIDRVRRSGARVDDAWLRAPTTPGAQREFCRRVCERVGFDFTRGRFDDSTHPFCEGIGPGDTRLTNRHREDGWSEALMTALHESGHGVYEQGLPKDKHFGRPIAESISLGIHESQSRMVENFVGRSRPFWQWAFPVAREVFGDALRGATPDAVWRAMNAVTPGLIRVESDEVTYNLHIMLRFDLECAMLNGDLRCRDVPGVWNERMKRDLGVEVPDDRRGCLQDIHWSMGILGYFPTYTFGNLYAAQFWEQIGRDIKDRDALMSKGEFAPILEWLRKKIHRTGKRWRAAELCRRITRKPLGADPLMRHLEAKVDAVYGG